MVDVSTNGKGEIGFIPVTQTMKIKTVSFQGLHGPNKKTYHFSQCNYLYGPNGAGKSTVLEAIQLALLGYIPGYSKRKEAVILHSDESNSIRVRLLLDDSTVIDRAFVKTGGSVSSELSVTPDTIDISTIISNIELPIFNFGEFRNMSANAIKDWFLSFLPNDDAVVDIKEELRNAANAANSVELDEDFISEIADGCKGGSSTWNSVEDIRNANTFIKSYLSMEKKNSERIKNTLQSLIKYDDVSDVDTEESVRLQIEEIDNQIQQHEQAARNQELKASAERILLESFDLHFCKNEVSEEEVYCQAKAAYQVAFKDKDECSRRLSALHDEIESVKREMNSMEGILASKGVCLYSNTICSAIEKEIDNISTKHSELSATLSKLSEEESAEKKRKANVEGECDTILNKLNYIEASHAKYLGARKQLEQLENEEVGAVSIDFLKEQKQALMEKWTHIKANQKFDTLYTTVSQENLVSLTKIDWLKAWDKLTGPSGLQSKLSTDPFNKFADKITFYIKKLFGEDVSAKFILSEKSNSFSFGISKVSDDWLGVSEIYHEYDLLSSGEKCLFTLALLTAILDSESVELKVMLVDDLLDHLDAENAKKVFDLFTSADCKVQFISAGVLPCNSPDIIIPISK